MQRFSERRWLELAVALAVGTVAAALLWLAGAPELSWLGYAAAGLAFAGRQTLWRCF